MAAGPPRCHSLRARASRFGGPTRPGQAPLLYDSLFGKKKFPTHRTQRVLGERISPRRRASGLLVERQAGSAGCCA